MGIQHVFSNAIPDGTNTQIVRPSDWNSLHAYTLQDAVSLAGNTSGALANVSSGTLILAGGNNITLSQNGNSVTISGANAAPAPVNFSAGAASGNLGSVVFSNSNGVSFGLNGSTITATVATNYQSQGAYLTTAMLSNAATISNVKLSAGATSGTRSDFTFADSNGVSFGYSTNGVITATVATNYQSQGAYLTTADLSQNSSNYAKNWKLTGNSAGTQSSAIGTDLWLAGGNGITLSGSSNSISFSVGNYLTTAMASNRGSDFVAATAAFAGTNASGTIASNGISVSVAAPGAAAENNWHNLLGANTAGNTTASGSTIGLSGINMTLSGTNNSQIVLSVPATSSLVGTNGISIATNGSTISVSQVQFTKSRFNPFMEAVAVAGQHGQGSLHIHPIPDAPNFQFDRLALDINWTNASNSSGSATISFWAGLYSRNVSTLSSMASASASVGITFAGTGGNQSLQAGGRLFTIGWTTTMTEADLWMAIVSRTTSGNTDGSASQYVVSDINSNFSGVFGVASNASAQDVLGLGYYSATTSGIPASIAFSDIRGTASMALRAPLYRFLSQTA